MHNYADSLAALRIDQGSSTNTVTTNFVQHLASPCCRCRVPLLIYWRDRAHLFVDLQRRSQTGSPASGGFIVYQSFFHASILSRFCQAAYEIGS